MSEVQSTEAAPPATVSVEVPAQHADLIQRAVALLKKEEQTIVDNFHAGVTMLENLFGHDAGDSNNP